MAKEGAENECCGFRLKTGSYFLGASSVNQNPF
jgi:hypothetical protein